MPKFLILVLYFIPLSCVSQNWDLINESEIHYYTRSDSIGVVNSMRIDSTYYQEQNQVHVLKDNFLTKKDTCIHLLAEDYPWYFWGNDSLCNYYNLGKGSILGKEIVELANGVFHINSGERIIKTNASLLETWVYDSSLQIDAKVTSLYLGSVLGIQDSIKEITLSDQFSEDIGMIKLSKNHGLIEIPFNNEIDFSLLELSSLDYGMTIDEMEQDLTYEVGDILVYQLRMYSINDFAFHGKNETRRIEIIAIDSSSILPNYICNVAYSIHIYDNESNMDIYHSDTLMSYIFKPLEWYLPSYSPPGEIGELNMKSPSFNLHVPILNLGTQNNFIGGDNLYASSTFYEYPDLPSELYFNNSLGYAEGDQFLFKGMYFQWDTYTPFTTKVSSVSSVLSNSVYALQPTAIDFYGMIFQEGKGLVQFGYYWFETEMMIEMVGLKKGEQEYGAIPSVSEILTIDEQSKQQIGINIYPNPFQTEINIISEIKGELHIYNVLGRELDVIPLSSENNKIDMTLYKGNAFILKFISDKGITTKKVLRAKN